MIGSKKLIFIVLVLLNVVVSIKLPIVKRYDHDTTVVNLSSTETDLKKENTISEIESNQGHSRKRESHLHHYSNNNNEGYYTTNIGIGLRSIAQGSADQANSAVASQHSAAIQAAYVAKNTLAQSAKQAASTALAALAGKEVIYHSVQLQREEAEKALENEILFLQKSKRALSATKLTLNHAKNQANLLEAALNAANNLVEYADIAVKESSTQLITQTEMVGKSKSRLETIEKKLHSVRIDYDATKQSAEKATKSAQEAQSNAALAGSHTNYKIANHNIKYINYQDTGVPSSEHYSLKLN